LLHIRHISNYPDNPNYSDSSNPDLTNPDNPDY